MVVGRSSWILKSEMWVGDFFRGRDFDTHRAGDRRSHLSFLRSITDAAQQGCATCCATGVRNGAGKECRINDLLFLQKKWANDSEIKKIRKLF